MTAPRILVTAGKGGVGKSTLAAATAADCAARGYRTLAMSVDSAHNLADLFGLPLGHTPSPIGDRLSGLEVDINRELAENWSAVTDFLRSLTADDPFVSELVAEECAVLPGMEEVFGLMRLQSVADSGDYDVIVLDAPPTGDLLKFLRLPDVLHWFVERYRPFERGLLQRVRPLTDALNWPVPPEESVEEVERWYARVRAVRATLMQHDRATVRLVMTPDRVALAETRRALSWTCLLGMNVDAVLVNKRLPPGDYPPALAPWVARQEQVLEEARQAFAPLPLLTADLRPQEVLGLDELRGFGAELFGERDPTGLWSSEPPLRWAETPDRAELALRIPFLKRGQFRLLASADGLVLHVGNQRRVVPLPGSVRRRTMRGARYEGDWLRVEFGPSRSS
jgi:arsenite-transporting ATPase